MKNRVIALFVFGGFSCVAAFVIGDQLAENGQLIMIMLGWVLVMSGGLLHNYFRKKEATSVETINGDTPSAVTDPSESAQSTTNIELLERANGLEKSGFWILVALALMHLIKPDLVTEAVAAGGAMMGFGSLAAGWTMQLFTARKYGNKVIVRRQMKKPVGCTVWVLTVLGGLAYMNTYANLDDLEFGTAFRIGYVVVGVLAANKLYRMIVGPPIKSETE